MTVKGGNDGGDVLLISIATLNNVVGEIYLTEAERHWKNVEY